MEYIRERGITITKIGQKEIRESMDIVNNSDWLLGLTRYYPKDYFDYLVSISPQIIQRKLEQLKLLKERPDYHPEPSAYHHIRIVTNRLIKKGYHIDLVLAGLLHDICKFDCVQQNKQTGYPTSPLHGQQSAGIIQTDMSVRTFIMEQGGNPDYVAEICYYHMKIQQYSHMKNKKKLEMEQLKCFADLRLFTECDNMLNKEYKMEDVLPFLISCEPTEGGTIYKAKFANEETYTELKEQEFKLYYGTGNYKLVDGCPDDIGIFKVTDLDRYEHIGH